MRRKHNSLKIQQQNPQIFPFLSFNNLYNLFISLSLSIPIKNPSLSLPRYLKSETRVVGLSELKDAILINRVFHHHVFGLFSIYLQSNCSCGVLHPFEQALHFPKMEQSEQYHLQNSICPISWRPCNSCECDLRSLNRNP